jgi:multiple sugar transport system substrate-binding protein
MLGLLTNSVNRRSARTMQSDTQFALRGMTWDHPRGFDPLVACSREWRERTGIEVLWERRSLQDFESFPVQSLARQYDLIVIDHPHVGQITREQCLLPLDGTTQAQHFVGASLDSYLWEGRLWALPIDAAAQVQAFRPDRLSAPVTQWSAMLELARAGTVHCPMRPPHNLMALFTLCGLHGRSAHESEAGFLDPEVGARAYESLQELLAHVDPGCFAMDPIHVFEAMSQLESPIACVPLVYGYISYARTGFRPARIGFADIPVLHAGALPLGSALGGTGIAVSAWSSQPQSAREFASWVTSDATQSGLYAMAGGQPANATAWADHGVNAPVHGFYTNTRATLEGSWVRPRHDGYMWFQEAGAQRLLTALRVGESATTAIAALNKLYRES